MRAVKHQWSSAVLIIGALMLTVVAILPQTKELFSRLGVNRGYLQLNQALSTHEPARLEESLATFSQFSPDSRMGQRAWRGLGLAYWSQSHFPAAIMAWERVPAVQSEFWSWAGQAERAGDDERARQWYWVATEMEPDNGDNWYMLAQSLSRLGDAGAHAMYIRALSAPERSEIGHSNILTRLGELEKQMGQPDWTAVLERFDTAIELDEFGDQADVIPARMGRAEALENLGRYQESLDEYLWIVRRAPDLYWANVHSGRLTWYVDRDAETAIAYLEKAIEIDGKPKWAYVSLGLVYVGSGTPDLAIPLFKKALIIDPDDSVSREQIDLLASGDES